MAKKTTKKKKSYSTKLKKNFSRYSTIKKGLIFACLFALVGAILLIVASAHPSPYDDALQAKLVGNPKLGITYKGLRAIKANADHPCKGIFEVEGVKLNGKPACTHGPDPAPDGIVISESNAIKRINDLKKRPRDKISTAKLASLTPQQITAYADRLPFHNAIPFPESAVPCTSGKYRIQPILITHVSDTDWIIPLMQSTALRMESQLEYSSLHSGPGSRIKHLRFVTNSSCQPIIKKVQTPDGYSLDNVSQAVSYLQNKGYTDSYTKYYIWVYSGNANFCGVAMGPADNNPSISQNVVNQRSGYASVDTTCWGTAADLHEITHTLGAVNNDSPHASGGGHCLDDHDIMCYPDHQINGVFSQCVNAYGAKYDCGQNGNPFYIAPNCTDPSFEFLLDCNKNDYFDSGTVSATNYLYDHWNTANSPYLQ